MQDREGATALHHAAFKGHAEVVEILLDNGAKIEATDYLGGTPLIVAAFNGKGIVDFLTKAQSLYYCQLQMLAHASLKSPFPQKS